MSVKVCCAEYLISDTNGLGPRRNWLPRVVAEAFLESKKDGEIKRAPDAVTMIDGDLTWFNATDDPQHVLMQVHKGPRSIVVSNPSTVVIHDAWSFDVGTSPTAEFPSVVQDTFGGRMQLDRASVAADKLKEGRYFLDGDDAQCYVDVGVIPPDEALHFRYLCAVQTPGTWTVSTEWSPRFEAWARWTRLVALGFPVATP